MLRHALEAQGHLVIEARDEPEAVQQMRQERPAVVLTDLKLPNGDGFGVLRAAKELDPELPVVVMTAYGSIQDAVTAMKEGAMDFLAKPVDPDHLLLMVARAIAQRRMVTENFLLKQELAERRGAPRIIGEDPKLRQVSQQLHRAAGTDTTVLLEGESGTGKELFARAVHHLSPRKSGPFVAINCAAIPDTLLENELFGHEKGAYTGAATAKQGRVEMADRGTLFLDEIGDVSPSVQAKLLRVLQEHAFERVGGTRTIEVDIRVVAATNQDLRRRVAEKAFREDLYFRLSVIYVELPPVRERREDIPELAQHFLREVATRRGVSLSLAPDAVQALMSHAFPGNVRELRNVVERAASLTSGPVITRSDLVFGRDSGASVIVARELANAGAQAALAAVSTGDKAPTPSVVGFEPTGFTPGLDFKEAKQRVVDAFESAYLRALLQRHDGNITRSAQEAGLTRYHLRELLKRHNLTSAGATE
jgi:DNA-binding NtrC family response regulator